MKCMRPNARPRRIRTSPEVPQRQRLRRVCEAGARIRDNCIDCHMPVQESNLIISNVNGKQIKARMRNHWIKVYAAPGN